MFKRYSLKKQFGLTFIVISISTIIAVLITLAMYLSLINFKYANPANYYEKMVPNIKEYVQSHVNEVLNSKNKDKLDKIIPQEGFKYEVINLKDNINYGSLNQCLSIDKFDLLDKINTTDYGKNNLVRIYIPLGNRNTLEGVIALEYKITSTARKMPKGLYKLMNYFLMVSPFVFLILFTMIFGSKLAKNIKEPLIKLIDASNKIKENDLDFNLNYPYNNELGKVISSFEEMRSELKTTLNKQWKDEEEKREMISALSHDLRSPLTVIKGNVELLEDGAYKNEERLLKHLKNINNSTDRAILLVGDLNTLNKIENPNFNLDLEKIVILKFIKDKVDEFKVVAENKGIEVKLINKNISLKEEHIFDKFAISRVLDNIFMNGLRFTEKGGKITIVICKEEDKIKFIIKDDGKGFSKEDLSLALNKFYRGDKARGKNNGNSGLGLYICKVIIEKHKGKISIYNNTPKGAVIEFVI